MWPALLSQQPSLPTSRAAAAEAGGPDSPRERERQVGMECQGESGGSFRAFECELGVLSGVRGVLMAWRGGVRVVGMC